MQKKLSPQSKSFIIFLSLAVIGVYLCLMLWWGSQPLSPYPGTTHVPPGAKHSSAVLNQASAASQISAAPAVDTSNWKTYANKTYGFSFQYKPGWQVKPSTKKAGFEIVQVDPGAKLYNIKIYISPSQFYGMDALPAKTATINNVDALDVNDALYGIKYNGNYFTFDVGLSMSLVPEFNALVHSVKFGG